MGTVDLDTLMLAEAAWQEAMEIAAVFLAKMDRNVMTTADGYARLLERNLTASFSRVVTQQGRACLHCHDRSWRRGSGMPYQRNRRAALMERTGSERIFLL